MIDYNSEDVVPTDLSHKEDFGAIDEIADVINDEHSENTDEYNNVDTEEKLRLNLLVPKKTNYRTTITTYSAKSWAGPSESSGIYKN